MTDIKSPNLTRIQRYIVLFFIYIIVLVAATFLAYGLRFDFVIPIEHQLHIRKIWFWVWPLKIAALAIAGQFSSLLSFFSIPDLKRLCLGTGIVTAGLLMMWSINDVVHHMSRGAIILDGIDPYYLTHKAQAMGYHPEIILAGRRLNDSMGTYIVSQLIKAMTKNRIQVAGAKVLVMGLTFKENCPDIRNTRIIDIIAELRDYHCAVDVYDPWVVSEEVNTEYGIEPIAEPRSNSYDAVILAVAHDQFRDMGAEKIRALGKSNAVLYDLKHVLLVEASDLRL